MGAKPNARQTGFRRLVTAVCAVAAFAVVFALGHWASSSNARGIAKRLLLQRRQPGRTLRIAICQYGTRGGMLPWNVDHAADFAEEAFGNGADLVILPEFSFSGFAELTALPELIAEFHRLEGPEKIRRVARQNRGWLQYNHPVQVDGAFYNETLLLDPDGRIAARYHKRNLALIDRRSKFSEGRLPVVADLPFGRMGFLTCRDLDVALIADQGPDGGESAASADDFAAACRSIEEYRGADLIVGQLAYAAWWTPTRRNVLVNDPITNALTRLEDAAAIWTRQTGAYVALVNKSGFEHGHGFTGGSLLVDPDGEILGRASSGTEILYVDLPLDGSGRIARMDRRGEPPEVVVLESGKQENRKGLGCGGGETGKQEERQH